MPDTVSLLNSTILPVTVDLLRVVRIMLDSSVFEDVDRSEKLALEAAFQETEREVYLLNDRLETLTRVGLDVEEAGGPVGRTEVVTIITSAAGVTTVSATAPEDGDLLFRGDVLQMGKVFSWPVLESETPSGTISGTNGTDGNATFTLLFPPLSTGKLLLFKNGMLQIEGSDYTLSGITITFLSGSIPIGVRSADILRAWYWRAA